MLAPNWKSAEELNITEDRRLALISTLHSLEREECKPFNMSGWCNCIHGHMMKQAGDRASELSMMGDINTMPLFIPDAITMTCAKRDYESITQAEAAQALRNFLVTGSPNWASALEA